MKTRTWEEIWQELVKLKGQAIYALKAHKRNDIINVESTGIKRRAESGKNYPVAKSEFKKVWTLLTKNGCGEIKKSGPFVFACMTRLQEVEYSKNPYALWLTEKHT